MWPVHRRPPASRIASFFCSSCARRARATDRSRFVPRRPYSARTPTLPLAIDLQREPTGTAVVPPSTRESDHRAHPPGSGALAEKSSSRAPASIERLFGWRDRHDSMSPGILPGNAIIWLLSTIRPSLQIASGSFPGRALRGVRWTFPHEPLHLRAAAANCRCNFSPRRIEGVPTSSTFVSTALPNVRAREVALIQVPAVRRNAVSLVDLGSDAEKVGGTFCARATSHSRRLVEKRRRRAAVSGLRRWRIIAGRAP